MKKTFTNFLAFTFFLVSWTLLPLSSYGQIVIEFDDYPQPDSYEVFRFQADINNVQIPAEGADQLWDYSNLEVIGNSLSVFSSAEGDNTFPGAKYVTPRGLTFQAFNYNSLVYGALDENGVYEMGRLPQDTTFSITAISGGPNDALRFVGVPLPFEGRLDLIRFPLSYQDSWTQTSREITPFELTVAAFGLDMVPGARTRITTVTRSVVGWGKLITPNREGESNEPRDVLLMRVDRMTIDSFSLASNPPPQPLMDAFGLTQGFIAEDVFYLFWDQYDNSNLMRVNISEGDIFSVFFKPDHNDIPSSVSALDFTTPLAYPNPISPLQELNIETDQISSNGTFVLTDMNGRQVHNTSFTALAKDKITVPIPAYLTPGMYVFQLIDNTGRVRGIGNISVK